MEKEQIRKAGVRFLFCVTVYVMFVALTGVHELVHYVTLQFDPYRKPIGIEVFNMTAIRTYNQWGRVVYQERYPGSFNDSPPYAMVIHETIAYSVEIVLSLLISIWIFNPIRKEKII